MVAQQLAIDHPDRVRSLALLSTTADLTVEAPAEAVFDVVRDMETLDAQRWEDLAVESLRLQTGSRWPFDEGLVRRHVEEAMSRAFRPKGGARQLLAILRSPPRTLELSGVGVPTLIVHGSEDPVLPVSHAYALHRALPDAKLVVVEGMGHAVPWGHWEVVLGPLLEHLEAVGSE